MSANDTFELTYATMFDPPEALHARYEAALETVKARLGQEHGLFIDGQDRFVEAKFQVHSPIDTDLLLGTFQEGSPQDVQDAIAAARRAFQTWGRTDWRERVTLMRRAADLLDERTFEIAAATSLEVGKTRMEALADVAEAVALIRYACDQMEANDGYVVEMGRDPLVGYRATNHSVLRPYGVWGVISPFNFPAALTGGPTGAALVTGNTVVIKPASDTPWTIRLLIEALRDAGLPDGVVNYVTGPGSTVGQTLAHSPDLDGITFTGSYEVGMGIYCAGVCTTEHRYPRPAILEMGGKNPSIVSRQADLERAAQGIVRSAFGLQGQKCSANSRIFIEEPVYEQLVGRIVELTQALQVGDPTLRETDLGPVINRKALADFVAYSEELSEAGTLLTGGHILTHREYAKGYFAPPTLVADVPMDHRLWKHEMFLPISMLHPVGGLDEAAHLANDVAYGLTAGFYGTRQEAAWFFDQIEAGVLYANRPHGATTGAWPGYQPFGGWKGSGSTGVNAGGHYYLPRYMREQIHTLIE